MVGTTPSGSCSTQAMLLVQIESPALERPHGRSEDIYIIVNIFLGSNNKMAYLVLLISFLSLNIFFTDPSWATYPTPDIAHWELSVSDERNDNDYQKVQNLVKEKKYDAALSILNKKIKELPK